MKTKKTEKKQILHKTGIICELNPPHIGHETLFRQVKKDGDALICVMSGNFVQRGEPAVYAKRERALSALKMGADIVAELPVPFAVSSSELFAYAGVRILHALGVETIAFGSECGDTKKLEQLAVAIDTPEIEKAVRDNIRSGISYAAARQKALTNSLGTAAEILKTPNNLLGIEYIRAVRRIGADIRTRTITRTPEVSSSRIRELLRRGDETAFDLMPQCAKADLRDKTAVFPEHLETAVLSRLRMLSFEDFKYTAGGGDGVAERVYKAVCKYGSLDEIFNAAKTKRHTMSRIRRYVLSCALGLKTETEPPYVRLLAANNVGCDILRASALPVVVKPAASRKIGGEPQRFMEIETAAADLYTLAYQDPALRRSGSEWLYSPVIINSETGR